MKISMALLTIFPLVKLNGCTQVISVSMAVAGAAASTALDVAASAAGAVTNAVTGGD